jgi:hypothetical protein
MFKTDILKMVKRHIIRGDDLGYLPLHMIIDLLYREGSFLQWSPTLVPNYIFKAYDDTIQKCIDVLDSKS